MVADRIANLLQSREPKNLSGDHYKLAAVLVPIQERDDGDHLVLTKRAEQLNHHRGQVAFPGGRVDPDDRGELAAALRESHEEIGIAPSDVRVLGRLDQVTAASDFVVTPFIGVIPPFYEFRLNPAETDAVFSVPSLSARSAMRGDSRSSLVPRRTGLSLLQRLGHLGCDGKNHRAIFRPGLWLSG